MTLSDRTDSAARFFDSTARPLPIALGDLRVLRSIAKGATATVVAAVRPSDGRRFAVKILTRDDLALRVRFEMEAKALSSVRHPHVVEVLATRGRASGPPFIVMPLLRGDTLRAHFDVSGRFSEMRAARLFGDVLAGLDAVHRAGVLHRDLNPRNIVLGSEADGATAAAPRPILIDFGLATVRPAATPSDFSKRHPALGNPAYMAPEQILGQATDMRTDVYGVGALLYEALAGRPPFTGDDPHAVLAAQVDRRAPRLDQVTLATRAISDVVARALEKRPADRYPSARAFHEALLPLALAPCAETIRDHR